PPVLLVKDDGAGLVDEAETPLDALDRLLEDLRRHVLVRRRVEAEREEGLPCARALAGGVGLLKRPRQVVRYEAPELVHLDMLVLVRPEQMGGQLPASAAL